MIGWGKTEYDTGQKIKSDLFPPWVWMITIPFKEYIVVNIKVPCQSLISHHFLFWLTFATSGGTAVWKSLFHLLFLFRLKIKSLTCRCWSRRLVWQASMVSDDPWPWDVTFCHTIDRTEEGRSFFSKETFLTCVTRMWTNKAGSVVHFCLTAAWQHGWIGIVHACCLYGLLNRQICHSANEL